VKPLTLLLFAVLIPSVLTAATKNWVGGDGLWSNGANWADGTPPVPGDDLAFPSVPSTHHLIDDYPAGTLFRSMGFAGQYDITGNGFSVSRGLSTSGGGTVTIGVPVTLAASQTWVGDVSFTSSASIDLGSFTLTLTQFRGSLDGMIVGSGSLVVSDSVISLSTSNAFTGATIVRGRTGLVHCACTLAGAAIGAEFGTFSFAPGAHAASAVAAGGTIDVADGPATSGDLALDAASVFSVESGSASHPALSVTGHVSLGDARLSFSAGFTPPVGTVFTLIDNDGNDAVDGAFTNLPEGTRFRWASGSPTAQISYAGGDGNDVTLTIVPEQIVTKTTLTVQPNPTAEGQQTTLIATVTGTDTPPTGLVAFYDGATPLASKPLAAGSGVVSVVLGPLSGGVHSLTATYLPDNAAFAGSTSDPVLLSVAAPRAATTTTLAVTPTATRRGEPVTMTVTVTSNGGTPAGDVIFADGATRLAALPLTAGTASFTTSDLGAGTHSLHATFLGSPAFLASPSNIVDVTVVEPNVKRRAVRP